MYYAMIDMTVSEHNPGVGFGNMRKAIAFDTKNQRKEFLKKRKEFDYSADKITLKILRLRDLLERIDDYNNTSGYHVIQKSKYTAQGVINFSYFEKNGYLDYCRYLETQGALDYESYLCELEEAAELKELAELKAFAELGFKSARRYYE